MFRRISLVSLVLGMTTSLSGGEFGMNNAEYYAGSAWQRAQNHSTGTWTNYSNPWDYYQLADFYRRQQMLQAAQELYQRAISLETAVRHDAHGQAPEPAKDVLAEVQSLRVAAYQLREHLRFGIHQGDLLAVLDRINALLDQQWWRRTSLKPVLDQKPGIEALAGRIQASAGPRLEIQNERFMAAKPVSAQAAGSASKTKAVGLSRPNR